MKHSFIKYVSWRNVKALAVCVALVLACITVNAQAKSFKSLSKIDGVTHVHIPKFMIKLASHNNEELHIGNNINIGDKSGDILKNISSVDVFTCEEEKAGEQLAADAHALTTGKDWEVLVSANEDGERVKICQNTSGRNNIFVILAEEKKEVSLVIIKGKLDLAKLMEQDEDKAE
jgi:hypothetical protein